MTTAKKNVKNFILQGGEHEKGGIWQRVLRYILFSLNFLNNLNLSF